MTEQNSKVTTKKGRSPAYPGIDLKRALELARIVYKAERQHPVASETVAQHWKLKQASSQFLTSISALKKFGLLDALPQRSAHSGQVKISDLARDIIVDEREDSSDRELAIKRAAMKPEIHADLWRKYNGELPSDANLRFYLIRDLKFTEAGTADFIAQFKRTIAFAGISQSDGVSATDGDRLAPEAGPERMTESPESSAFGHGAFQQKHSQKQGQMREVPIVIQGSAWPILKLPVPMSRASWDKMMKLLDAMKDGLIEAESEP